MSRSIGLLVVVCVLLVFAIAADSPQRRPARGHVARVRATPSIRPAVERPPVDAGPAASSPPSSRRYVVAVIGDSITDTRVGGGKYVAELARLCPKSVFDAFGVGGQETHHVLERFGEDVLRPRRKAAPVYTDVIVFGGINDLRRGFVDEKRLAEIEGHLTAMYRVARGHGLGVVALTVPLWAPHTEADRANDARLDAFILAQERDGVVDHAVDLRLVLVCGEDGESGTVCPQYRKTPGDSVHWGALGHEVVGREIQRVAFADCE